MVTGYSYLDNDDTTAETYETDGITTVVAVRMRVDLQCSVRWTGYDD